MRQTRFALATLAMAAPAMAFAQPATPPAPPSPPAEAATNYAQRNIERMHRELRITAAQEPAFAAFANEMTTNAAAMRRAYEDRRMDASGMSAPQNVSTYADLQEARAQEARSLVAPFQALYAQLTPEQQRTADDIFRRKAERIGRKS